MSWAVGAAQYEYVFFHYNHHQPVFVYWWTIKFSLQTSKNFIHTYILHSLLFSVNWRLLLNKMKILLFHKSTNLEKKSFLAKNLSLSQVKYNVETGESICYLCVHPSSALEINRLPFKHPLVVQFKITGKRNKFVISCKSEKRTPLRLFSSIRRPLNLASHKIGIYLETTKK